MKYRRFFEAKLISLTKNDPYKTLLRDQSSKVSNSDSQSNSWFKSYGQKKEELNQESIIRTDILPNQEYITGFYGCDYRQGPVRDWNEEY
jgi:hypothetical protein